MKVLRALPILGTSDWLQRMPGFRTERTNAVAYEGPVYFNAWMLTLLLF